MRFLQISVIVLFVLLQGCGRNESPVAPQSDYSDTPSHFTDSQTTVPTNRYIWGIWDVRILGDRETVEIIPDRSSTMHFNIVRLMEEVPCTTCIAIIIKQLIPPDILSVDFRLQHPFPGPMNLCAFDLRGIIINGADYTFPANNRSVGMGHDKLVLLDPDGYTSLFNPTEFSEDTGMPPVLRYYPGKLEMDGDLSSTLNPFIAYSQDLPRRVFYVGSAETRNIQVRLPDVPVEFGYAVDISWMPVENVVDPLVDFPLEANCVEAYRIDLPDYIQVSAGGMSEVVVEIFDHQGYETISSVTVEAPEIFSGVIPFDFVESTGIESCTYSGEFTNELNAMPENYPLLVRVTDKFLDDIHGQVDAWHIGEVTVPEPPKEDPIAIAMADPLSVYTGDQVHFFDDGSYDPDGGDIVLFEWDWDNDGTPDETGEDVFHSWTDPGTYEVQFRVTDDEGATDELDGPFVIEVTEEIISGLARTWGGSDYDQGFGVATDGSGNVYATGDFMYTVDFALTDPPCNEDPDEHTSNGYQDTFLTKH
ncbi:PKD domain-containing protein, partial [bacterium]|nr:PKD domain-containing protein [bacterium]